MVNPTNRAVVDLALAHQLIGILPIPASCYVMDRRAVYVPVDTVVTDAKNVTTATTVIQFKESHVSLVFATLMAVSATNAMS